MSIALRRGACPSLSAPMPTGDGLLARLRPAGGAVTPRQLEGIAEAAAHCGNGVLEITARGSLQIRGLTAVSAGRLREAIAALDIAADEGPAVTTGPLAGLDTTEVADPRPLAAEIRRRVDALDLGPHLGPKVSVVVDGGGALPLSGIAADVRLVAVTDRASPGWWVAVGGDASTERVLACCSAAEAAAVTVSVLARLAANGRDARAASLNAKDLAELGPSPADSAPPVIATSIHAAGRFRLKDGSEAQGFCLAFGQATARDLIAFANATAEASEIRLSHGRGMLVLGMPAVEIGALVKVAHRLGMVTDANDPRLGVVACAGAPACASAHLATKAFAAEIVTHRPPLFNGPTQLHVSGCPKCCAQPSGPTVNVIAHADGAEVLAEGAMLTEPARKLLAGRARRYLLAGVSGHG